METLISPSSSAPSPRPRPRLPPPPHPPRPLPAREDLWSEAATFTLIKAWADHRHIAHANQIHNHHNHGGANNTLRQSHWKLVADAVNAVHGHTKKSRRTDVQCKNRIDTIKKKYKAELARFKGRGRGGGGGDDDDDDDGGGDYVSPWPFFSLFHSVVSKEEKEKAIVLKRKRSRSRSPMMTRTPLIPTPMTRGPRSALSKRPAIVDGSFFRRNFGSSAPAVKSEESDDEEEEERGNGGSETEEMTSRGEEEGCRELARAIARFGEVYERVEVMKQERLVELEKQRMQFLKDLEYQRMKLLMDTHFGFGRRKRAKGSDDADSSL